MYLSCSLGVALRRIALWQSARLRLMEAEDPSLTEGFHAFETDNGFRWTDGYAAIPASLFDGLTGPAELELTIASTAHYLDEGGRQQVA